MADEQQTEQAPPDTPPQQVMSVEDAFGVVGQALARARFPDLSLGEIQTVLQAWGIVAAELTAAQAKKNGNRAQRRRTAKK